VSRKLKRPLDMDLFNMVHTSPLPMRESNPTNKLERPFEADPLFNHILNHDVSQLASGRAGPLAPKRDDIRRGKGHKNSDDDGTN
jgi:hypothetical protein